MADVDRQLVWPLGEFSCLQLVALFLNNLLEAAEHSVILEIMGALIKIGNSGRLPLSLDALTSSHKTSRLRLSFLTLPFSLASQAKIIYYG